VTAYISATQWESFHVDLVGSDITMTGAPETEAPSTRYKDLVDLVAIVTVTRVDADAQRIALASEAERRHITLPRRFEVPARELWERGYNAEAARWRAGRPDPSL